MYGLGAEDSTNEGVGCSWCCRGDCSGDPLESDERSEPDEWMDCSCSSSVSACLGRIRRQGDVGGKCREAVTYIILSEQVEGAEHLIVFNVKGAGSLKVALVGDERRRLYVELLGGADLAELLVVLLGRDSGSPSGAAAVVVVRVGVEVLSMVLLGTVVEELRHDYAAGG